MMSTFPTGRRRDWIALCGALALFALMLATQSCGSGDLVFPGDFPATETAAPTSTPVP